MAGRIRTIKPELRELLAFAQLTDRAARLFLMLYTLADDEGRCPASPSYLAGQVFFARPTPANAIGKALAELEEAALIHRYDVKNAPFVEICGWNDRGSATHQRIDKPQPNRWPSPESNHADTSIRSESHSAPGSRNGSSNGSQSDSWTDPTRPDPTSTASATRARAHAIPPSTGPVLVPPPAPEPPPGSSKLPTAAEIASEEQRRKARNELADSVWMRLDLLRTVLGKELGISLRPLPITDIGRTALGMRIREAERATGDLARAEADCDHVLLVAEAEARATRSVQWLTSTMFEDTSWRRKLGMSLDDARSSRTGPRSVPEGQLRDRNGRSDDDMPPMPAWFKP